MTYDTWKTEFYPTDGTECKTELEALKHALRKWRGFRKEALEKHRIAHFTPIEVSMGTFCALCEYRNGDCAPCILRNMEDQKAYCNGDASYYRRFKLNGDPEPMIQSLEQALVYLLTKTPEGLQELENLDSYGGSKMDPQYKEALLLMQKAGRRLEVKEAHEANWHMDSCSYAVDGILLKYRLRRLPEPIKEQKHVWKVGDRVKWIKYPTPPDRYNGLVCRLEPARNASEAFVMLEQAHSGPGRAKYWFIDSTDELDTWLKDKNIILLPEESKETKEEEEKKMIEKSPFEVCPCSSFTAYNHVVRLPDDSTLVVSVRLETGRRPVLLTVVQDRHLAVKATVQQSIDVDAAELLLRGLVKKVTTTTLEPI